MLNQYLGKCDFINGYELIRNFDRMQVDFANNNIYIIENIKWNVKPCPCSKTRNNTYIFKSAISIQNDYKILIIVNRICVKNIAGDWLLAIIQNNYINEYKRYNMWKNFSLS